MRTAGETHRAAARPAVAGDFLATSRRLLDVLGGDGLGGEWEQRDLAVDGVEPRWVALPESEAQVAAVLRIASEEGLAVVPAGRGARLAQGRPPSRLDLVLSTERLARTIEHADADLTLTIEAGATLADLAARLRPAKQWLPLDPPFPERTTVGGLVAANASGPARLGHGTVRESLIGLRAVLADGTIVKSGGRVVKNVAGYDVHRLLVGSFGTLAVVTAASFRLQPTPETTRALAFSGADLASLLVVGRTIAASPARPRSVDVVVDRDGARRLLVGLAGFAEEVEAATARVRDLVHASAAIDEITAAAATSASEDSRSERAPGDRPTGAGEALAEIVAADAAAVVLRLGVPPAELRRLLPLAVERARGAAESVSAQAHAGVGVARLRLDAAAREAVAALVTELRAGAARSGGHLVVEAAPASWTRAIDPWGAPAGGRELARGIKQAFDPRGVLAPGRFVEGT